VLDVLLFASLVSLVATLLATSVLHGLRAGSFPEGQLRGVLLIQQTCDFGDFGKVSYGLPGLGTRTLSGGKTLVELAGDLAFLRAENAAIADDFRIRLENLFEKSLARFLRGNGYALRVCSVTSEGHVPVISIERYRGFTQRLLHEILVVPSFRGEGVLEIQLEVWS
jgi:hypothetical protein